MRIIVDMPDVLVATLDKEAKRLDRSRAWVIRARCRRELPVAEPQAAHEFKPRVGNALVCADCGGKVREH